MEEQPGKGAHAEVRTLLDAPQVAGILIAHRYAYTVGQVTGGLAVFRGHRGVLPQVGH